MYRTPIKFYAEQSSYVVGEGFVTSWEPIKTGMKLDDPPTDPLLPDTGLIQVSAFWCNWQNAFGKHVLDAQAVGVGEMATVRMAYNPTLYNALRTGKVVVAKNGTDVLIDGLPNKDNVDAYSVFGGVDNVKEENQSMEFKVRRYESQ